MLRSLLLLTTFAIGLPCAANEPARRPVAPVHSIPAQALCKDSRYNCMYACEVKEGSVCLPTRNSDPNCQAKTVSGGMGRVARGQTIVLWFAEQQDMGCYVTKSARTDLVCGNTKFGYECWTGRMHDE